MVKPGRKVRPIPRRRYRLAEARRLKRLDFAVGIAPGQRAVQRHTGSIQIRLRRSGCARELLGSEKARRSGTRRARGLVRVVGVRLRHAEIHQPQLAVIAEMHIRGFNVPVHYSAPMQDAQRARKLRHQVNRIGHREMTTIVDLCSAACYLHARS